MHVDSSRFQLTVFGATPLLAIRLNMPCTHVKQHRAVQRGTVWCGIEWVQCSTVWYSVVQCCTVRVKRHNAVSYNMHVSHIQARVVCGEECMRGRWDLPNAHSLEDGCRCTPYLHSPDFARRLACFQHCVVCVNVRLQAPCGLVRVEDFPHCGCVARTSDGASQDVEHGGGDGLTSILLE